MTFLCPKSTVRVLFALFLGLLVSGCEPLISPYSEEAYRQATSLKARALALVLKSDEAFSRHSNTIDALLVDVDAAYEYARGLPRNDISARQWAIMRSPDEGLLGEFVEKWRRDGTTSTFYRTEKRAQIERGFDYIICLEVNKDEPTSCE